MKFNSKGCRVCYFQYRESVYVILVHTRFELGPQCGKNLAFEASKDPRLLSLQTTQWGSKLSVSWRSLIFIYIYMNTCQVPNLEMSSKRFTMATTALFSASEQTHCTQVVCRFQWVTVAFTTQLYCLCVKKFAFWLVIYIKHLIYFTIKQQFNKTLSWKLLIYKSNI